MIGCIRVTHGDEPSVTPALSGNGAARPGIAGVEDDRIAGTHIREYAPLRIRIVFHRVMPVDVIRRDVEKDRDLRVKGG